MAAFEGEEVGEASLVDDSEPPAASEDLAEDALEMVFESFPLSSLSNSLAFREPAEEALEDAFDLPFSPFSDVFVDK